MLRAAARRSAALAPAARRVHAQWRAPNSGAPVRQSMDPKWVPLFMRLSRGSTPGAAAAELTEWVRANRPVSQDQIVAYVRTICSFNNSRALELMDWMEANVAELTHGHHALHLNLISKVKGIKAAEEYFWSLPDVFKSVKTYSAPLNCYAEHGIEDKGLELYEKMKAMNFGPSTLVYNNLMSLYM